MYMRGEMFGQVVGPGETLAADLAVVGTFTRVYAQVTREITFAPEGATAEQANERSLSGVLSYVQFEILFRADAFAAVRAGEPVLSLPLGRVHPQKIDQGRLLVES